MPHRHADWRISRRPICAEALEGDKYDEGFEEPNLYAYPRVPNTTYARDT
jgi:hypothetical protein